MSKSKSTWRNIVVDGIPYLWMYGHRTVTVRDQQRRQVYTADVSSGTAVTPFKVANAIRQHVQGKPPQVRIVEKQAGTHDAGETASRSVSQPPLPQHEVYALVRVFDYYDDDGGHVTRVETVIEVSLDPRVPLEAAAQMTEYARTQLPQDAAAFHQAMEEHDRWGFNDPKVMACLDELGILHPQARDMVQTMRPHRSDFQFSYVARSLPLVNAVRPVMTSRPEAGVGVQLAR